MIDIVGNQYNRLTVLQLDKKDEKHRLYWLCKCICGETKTIRGDRLKKGITKSCGCLHKEKLKQIAEERKSKGKLKKERLYVIWIGIKQRCLNVNCNEYKRYGHKGIKICDSWLNDYQDFKKWSMKNGYKENLSIDRIDVYGNYEPSNCKWSDAKEQANNRTNNLNITFNNKTQTLAQWSEELNITYSCLYRRIKSNWSIEKAFNLNNNNESEEN